MLKQILVITDATNEFTKGVLGNKECEAAIPFIVDEINSKKYDKIIVTQDTHGADYLETQEGRRLPIVHGQKGTEGYELHKDIIAALKDNYDKKDIVYIEKPTFGSIELGNVLLNIYHKAVANGDTLEVYFTGFCTDICVMANVVIAKTYAPEARVCVITKACAGVTIESHETAINAMKMIQVDMIE